MHRHLNKQGGGRAVYRGLGSIAFVAACRFATLVGRDPLAPERCILAQVRSSLARQQPSLVYQLNAVDGALPTVDWLGTSLISADEILACAGRRGRGPRDLAATFVEQFLAAGPRTSRDIWTAAQKAGLSHAPSTAPRKSSASAVTAATATAGKSVTGCCPARKPPAVTPSTRTCAASLPRRKRGFRRRRRWTRTILAQMKGNDPAAAEVCCTPFARGVRGGWRQQHQLALFLADGSRVAALSMPAVADQTVEAGQFCFFTNRRFIDDL
jgi:hypothetical protein